jgi:hypothetical protein
MALLHGLQYLTALPVKLMLMKTIHIQLVLALNGAQQHAIFHNNHRYDQSNLCKWVVCNQEICSNQIYLLSLGMKHLAEVSPTYQLQLLHQHGPHNKNRELDQF